MKKDFKENMAVNKETIKRNCEEMKKALKI